MKVLTVFPPQWIPYRAYLSRPYLSVPSLTAYLKANGIDAVQRDLNIEVYDLILTKEYLLSLRDRLKYKLKLVESKEKLMPGTEQSYYSDLVRANASLEDVAGNIESAKRVFKTESFYDVNSLWDARKTIDQALSIVSTAYFPTNPDLFWFAMPPFQGTLEEMQEITQNRDENPFVDLYEKHFFSFIEKQNTEVICISLIYNSQLIPALTLSRLIKKALPNVHVMFGGCVLTLLGETLSKHKSLFDVFFDSVAVLDGERPLLELTQHVSDGRPLTDVPNLFYLDDGEIRQNPILPGENINNLPTPNFDGFPMDLYLSPEPVLPLISSKACYWGKCAFCTDNSLTFQGRYQKRDEKKVVNDIEELNRKYGAVHFAFSDECISPSAINRISDEIMNRGLSIKCSTNARLERQFTPELCTKISRAGFKLLFLGFESGSNRILKQMKKGNTKEMSAEVCANLHNAGIWDHLYVFFGFPTETRVEAQETIDFLINNKNIIQSFNLEAFILETGSETKKNPEKYGIEDVNSGKSNDFALASNYGVSTGLSSNEAELLSKVYREKIRGEYDSGEVMRLLAQDDLILYLSHFEESDPLLRSVKKYDSSKVQPAKQLTSKSRPQVARHIAIMKLRYNLTDLIRNNKNGINEVSYPSPNYLMFDPATGQSSCVSEEVFEIINQCDGQNTISQIAFKLSKEYNAPRYVIERDCNSLLKPLVERGFIGYS